MKVNILSGKKKDQTEQIDRRKDQKVWHVTQIMYGALSVFLGAFLYQLYTSFGGLKLKCLFLMLKQQLSKFGSYSKLAATHLADIHDLPRGFGNQTSERIWKIEDETNIRGKTNITSEQLGFATVQIGHLSLI